MMKDQILLFCLGGVSAGAAAVLMMLALVSAVADNVRLRRKLRETRRRGR